MPQRPEKKRENKAKRAKENKKGKPPKKWNKIIVASIAAILWLDPQKKVSSRQNRARAAAAKQSDRSRGIFCYLFFFLLLVSFAP